MSRSQRDLKLIPPGLCRQPLGLLTFFRNITECNIISCCPTEMPVMCSTEEHQIYNGATLHVDYPMLLILCMLMHRRLKPGHRQAWYRPNKPECSVYSIIRINAMEKGIFHIDKCLIHFETCTSNSVLIIFTIAVSSQESKLTLYEKYCTVEYTIYILINGFLIRYVQRCPHTDTKTLCNSRTAIIRKHYMLRLKVVLTNNRLD